MKPHMYRLALSIFFLINYFPALIIYKRLKLIFISSFTHYFPILRILLRMRATLISCARLDISLWFKSAFFDSFEIRFLFSFLFFDFPCLCVILKSIKSVLVQTLQDTISTFDLRLKSAYLVLFIYDLLL